MTQGNNAERAMVDEKLYYQWLELIFVNGAEDEESSANFESLNPNDLVKLIRLTCVRSGTDLQRYSNDQLSCGLRQMLTPDNNFVFAFKESGLAYQDIVNALQSIWYLYLDLFNERCDPVLSHLSEPTDNSLNTICYMLWDETPLDYWEDSPNNAKQYYAAVLSVMEKALNLNNAACLESALHGLGHMHLYAKDRVERIITAFLKNARKQAPELLRYAENARVGAIQ